MKCLISAIFVSNTHTDARTRANISKWVEGEPFKAQQTAIHISALVWFCLHVKLQLGQDLKAISCLTRWLNTASSNAAQEHFSHPRHTSSALRSDKHHQKRAGRSDGNSSGETRGERMEGVTEEGGTWILWIAYNSAPKTYKQNISKRRWPDGGLCHWAHRSSWDWRAAGWLDLCSVNKWPEEQKHKHHKLAWLLRHGSSSGAACMLHVTDTVSGLKTSRLCAHKALPLQHSVVQLDGCYSWWLNTQVDLN